MRPGTVAWSPASQAAAASAVTASSTALAAATWAADSRRVVSPTMATTRSPASNMARWRSSAWPAGGRMPSSSHTTAPAATLVTSTRSTGSPAARRSRTLASSGARAPAHSRSVAAGVNSPASLRRRARWASPSMLSSTDGPSTGVHRAPEDPGPSLRNRSGSPRTSLARAASLTTTPTPGTGTAGPARATRRSRG